MNRPGLTFAKEETAFEEIRAMLLEDLPQVEDTVWGRELIQIHLEKGRKEGREAGRLEGTVCAFMINGGTRG